MSWTVVFDVDRDSRRCWLVLAVALVFAVLGVIQGRFARKPFARSPFYIPIFLLSFASLLTVMFVVEFFAYRRLSSALHDGRCAVDEGVISDFHSSPNPREGDEWFEVNNERFTYSSGRATVGFSTISTKDGPIRKGLRVRVRHLGNEIARLEVAR